MPAMANGSSSILLRNSLANLVLGETDALYLVVNKFGSDIKRFVVLTPRHAHARKLYDNRGTRDQNHQLEHDC